MAEEKRQQRRAYNVKARAEKRKLIKGQSLEINEKSHYDVNESGSSSDENIIVLPSIVRNFAEGKITVEIQEFFLSIISEWYCEQLHQIYIKNENVVYSSQISSQNSGQVSKDFERIEDNFTPLLQLLQEKYKEDQQMGSENQHKHIIEEQMMTPTGE